MPDVPLLLPVQKELLIMLVEAAEQTSSDQREHFNLMWWQGDGTEAATLQHSGLGKDQSSVFRGDIEVLVDRGLLLISDRGKQSFRFTVLPEAYVYYGLIKDPPIPAARAAVRVVLAQTLENARRALRVLELTAARYGETSLPPHIALDREDKQVEIETLEQRLHDLDET